LYAWVLKKTDDQVRGRQWITELGVKRYKGSFELSCVLRTEEQSTLVADPVHASRPRVIRYLATNIDQASDAKLGANTAGVLLKTVGETIDSYRGLLADIERRDREYPIVLVSPTADGEYLVDPDLLQDDLIGIGQVVRIAEGFNSYDMEGILGRHWSAWSGAINVLAIRKRCVNGTLFG
jgi:hypothetical protein